MLTKENVFALSNFWRGLIYETFKQQINSRRFECYLISSQVMSRAILTVVCSSMFKEFYGQLGIISIESKETRMVTVYMYLHLQIF